MILPLLSLCLLPTSILADPMGAFPLCANATSAAPAHSAKPEEIQWFQGPHMSALGKARHEKRPLALYFWMDGSALCSKMYAETLADPAVISELQAPLCVGIDIASGPGTQLVQRYGITTLPTLLFLNSEGEREEAVIGFINGPSLVVELQRIATGTGTVSDFRRQVAANPQDLALQHSLALKLRDVGDQAGHDELVASIRSTDPKGKTITGARLLFWETRAAALSQGAPADVDLKSIYEIARKLNPPSIRYEAWDWLATFELGRGQTKPSRVASQEAWKHAAPNQLPFGLRTTMNFWDMREELNRREIDFLGDMSAVYLKQARETFSPDGVPAPAAGNEEETPANLLARALDAASIALFLDGKKTKAIQLIEEAIQVSPESEDLARRLSLYGR